MRVKTCEQTHQGLLTSLLSAASFCLFKLQEVLLLHLGVCSR